MVQICDCWITLDQHSVLEEGQSVRDVLRTAFDELFKAEARINDLYMEMAEDGADVDALMEEVGESKTVWRVVISIPWMLRLTKLRVPLVSWTLAWIQM